MTEGSKESHDADNVEITVGHTPNVTNTNRLGNEESILFPQGTFSLKMQNLEPRFMTLQS